MGSDKLVLQRYAYLWKTSVWDHICVSILVHYFSKDNGRPEDDVVNAETCHLYEYKIN
jgi:hypothetical protein